MRGEHRGATGTFTAQKAGVYDFTIRINTDDGGTGIVPQQYYIVMEGVPRPSDSFMDCQIPASGTEYPCSVSFIMNFPSANQQFTFVNESGIPMYYGYYDGDPFANEMELSVFELN